MYDINKPENTNQTSCSHTLTKRFTQVFLLRTKQVHSHTHSHTHTHTHTQGVWAATVIVIHCSGRKIPGFELTNQTPAFQTLALQLESLRDHPLHMDHRLCVCLVISAPSGLKYTHVTHSRNTSSVKAPPSNTQRTQKHTFRAVSVCSCWFLLRVKCVLNGHFSSVVNQKVLPHFQMHCVWTCGGHTLRLLQYTLEWPWGSIDACRQPIFSNVRRGDVHTHTLTPPSLITESQGTRHSSSTSVFA